MRVHQTFGNPSVTTVSSRFQPGWLVAQTFMGITTFYKHDPDGSLWIKMHGTMDDVGIMDQLATVREVDLYNEWVPFCNTSTLLKRLGMVELLVYFAMSAPGFSRWVAYGKTLASQTDEVQQQ